MCSAAISSNAVSLGIKAELSKSLNTSWLAEDLFPWHPACLEELLWASASADSKYESRQTPAGGNLCALKGLNWTLCPQSSDILNLERDLLTLSSQSPEP